MRNIEVNHYFQQGLCPWRDLSLCGARSLGRPADWTAPQGGRHRIALGIMGRLEGALSSSMVQILEIFCSYLLLSPYSLSDCCCGGF